MAKQKKSSSIRPLETSPVGSGVQQQWWTIHLARQAARIRAICNKGPRRSLGATKSTVNAARLSH